MKNIKSLKIEGARILKKQEMKEVSGGNHSAAIQMVCGLLLVVVHVMFGVSSFMDQMLIACDA